MISYKICIKNIGIENKYSSAELQEEHTIECLQYASAV